MAPAPANRFGLWLLLGMILGCAAAPKSIERAVVDPPTVGFTTLSFRSGLRIVIEPDPTSSLVGVVLVVGAGATSDPAGREGLAHLVEHLTFQARGADGRSIWDRIRSLGVVRANGTTELDFTSFGGFVLPDVWERLLALEISRLADPLAGIDEKSVENERKVLRNELRFRSEHPFSLSIMADLQAAVFPAGHLYSRAVGGTEGSLDRLTLDDARRFARAQYVPSAATIHVMGNLPANVSARVIDLLTNDLKTRPRAVGPPAVTIAPQGRGTGGDRAMQRREGVVASPEIWLGWPLPSRFGAEAALVTVVDRVASSMLTHSTLLEDDPDIAGLDAHILRGAQGSLLACRVTLLHGRDPEQTAQVVLKRFSEIWGRYVGGQVQALLNTPSFGEPGRSLAERAGDHGVYFHFTDNAWFERAAMTSLAASERRFELPDSLRVALEADRARVVIVMPSRIVPGSELPQPTAVNPAAAERGEQADATESPPLDTPILPRIREFKLANGLTVALVAGVGRGVVALVGFRSGPAAGEPPGFGQVAGATSTFLPNLRTPGNYRIREWPSWGLDGHFKVFAGATAVIDPLLDFASSRHEPAWVEWPSSEAAQFLRTRRTLFESNPGFKADTLFFEALMRDTPYRHVPMLADMDRAAGDAIRTWMIDHQRANNAALILVGDFDEGEAEAIVTKRFSGWPAGPAVAPTTAKTFRPVLAPRPRLIVTDNPGLTQIAITIGCLVPDVEQSHWGWGARLLADRIKDDLASLLRQRTGSSYSNQVSLQHLRDAPPTLKFNASIGVEYLEGVLPLIGEYWRALKDRIAGVTDWSASIRAAVGEEITGRDSSVDLATTLFRRWNRNQPLDLTATSSAPPSSATASMPALAATCQGTTVVSLRGDRRRIEAALAKTTWTTAP